MPTTNERVAILETKVDDLKEDVGMMRKENKEDHGKVIEKLQKLESNRQYLLGAVAIIGPILMYIVSHIDWKKLF